MKYEAVELAQFARDAGFDYRNTPIAVAVALSGSGGLSSFDFAAGTPGTGRWVGLWSIDVDRYPEYADRALHDPRVNAQTARQLVDDHGGWSWSPVWRAGGWQAFADHAAVEASRHLTHQRPARPVNTIAASHRIDDALHRVRSARAQASRHTANRGEPWPQTSE